MNNLSESVLIVDDEFLISAGLRIQVRRMGKEVCAIAGTALAAIALAQKHRPGIVLMDVRLRGEMDGVDAARAIHDSVGSRVIFITGSREPETQARIEMDHPTAVLFKPISARELQIAITGAAQD